MQGVVLVGNKFGVENGKEEKQLWNWLIDSISF